MTRHERNFWGVLAITLLVMSCEDRAQDRVDSGPSPGPSEARAPFIDGSRFQARYLKVPGGEPLLLSVADRQRDRDCLFVQDASGTVRCAAADAEGAGKEAGEPVEGQLGSSPIDARLSGRELITPDGGRFPLFRLGRPELTDARWATACTPVEVGDGVWRCLPPYAADSYLFTDPGCFDPLVQQRQDEPPLLAVVKGIPRGLGDVWTGDMYVGFGGSGRCGPLGAPYHAPLRKPGPPLPDDAVIRLYRAPRGHDRLGLLALHVQDQPIGPARQAGNQAMPAYFDRQLNLECTPMRTPAGVLCLGGVTTAREKDLRYMDAACSRPVLSVPVDEVVLLAEPDGHPLARATEIRHLGPWYGGAVVDVYVREGTTCQLRPEKNTFSPLTEAGDWSRFAPLEQWLGGSRL